VPELPTDPTVLAAYKALDVGRRRLILTELDRGLHVALQHGNLELAQVAYGTKLACQAHAS
jgi:hypothetical protein